jgi:hypothetical protein
MRVIISPAKKMNVDTDSFPCRDLPQFLEKTEQIAAALRRLPDAALQSLWRCNDTIAKQNIERLHTMDLRRNLTPALLAYEGIQYQRMAPGVFTDEELRYVEEHLRILSGFYGILRPFDGVVPYRLEMQAKLAVGGAPDLYTFWGRSLADSLSAETDCIVNLASKEYSRSIEPYLSKNVRLVTCIFAEEKGGRLIEKGTLCKMARGMMVRFLAQNNVRDLQTLREFDRGYRFAADRSDDAHFVFIREEI